MNIKRNIIFALESRKKNGIPITENVPIRMRVVYAGNRIELTTGYRIDADKWDADKQQVKNKCTNKLRQSASEINADLSKYRAGMQDIFKEFEVQDILPTTEEIKDAFNRRLKSVNDESENSKEISFWKVYDEFVKECGTQNNWMESTYKKMAAVKNHIAGFSPQPTFEAFDEEGLSSYVDYLRGKDMRNSTIGKQLGFLKWFIRWAHKKVYHNNIAYDTFKPKLKSTQKMNYYLKELGELAGIDEPIRETYYKGNKRIDDVTPKYALLGTHAGRRTFICNALALGIPAQVVMKWTGHSDYKAMKPYIDIADDIKANAMSKFNQL